MHHVRQLLEDLPEVVDVRLDVRHRACSGLQVVCGRHELGRTHLHRRRNNKIIYWISDNERMAVYTGALLGVRRGQRKGGKGGKSSFPLRLA